MTCDQCGNENSLEAQFCAYCGASMSSTAGDISGRGTDAFPARDLGQLISETFHIYQRHFLSFYLIAFIAGIPSLVDAVVSGWISVIFAIIGFLLVVIAAGATIHGVGLHYLGQPVRVSACYQRACYKAFYLIAAFLLFILILFGTWLLMFLIIGIPLFVYLIVSLFFYAQPIMMEDVDALAGLGRSRELVRGNWWRVFGIGIVFFLMLILPLMLVSLLAPAGGTIGAIIATFLGSLITPLAYIGATLVYIDLRARKEGYTLEKMAEEVQSG